MHILMGAAMVEMADGAPDDSDGKDRAPWHVPLLIISPLKMFC